MNTTKTNPYRFKPGVGSVSHGTMRAQDLIPAFLDTLRELAPNEHAQYLLLPFGPIPSHAQEDDDADWWQSEECDERLHGLFETLNSHAPTGLYFGAHPGDGSDYGFWPSESLTEDFDGFVSIKSAAMATRLGVVIDPDDASYPSPDYRGEWLHVNDHGNCTLYVRDDSGDHEVWSCV